MPVVNQAVTKLFRSKRLKLSWGRKVPARRF